VARPWFPLYPGDYLQDTQHLGPTEHGIYLMLMCQYYSTGKPLPANAMQLQRVCKCFADQEAQALQAVLQEFFDEHDGLYHHARIDAELKKANKISSKRSEAARKRHAKAPANAQQLQVQLDTQPQPQPQKDIDTSAAADRCPYEKIIEIYHQELPSLPKAQTMTNKRRSSIRARWTENKKHQSLEFWQWFFSKVRANPWWMGEAGDWKIPNFDWLMNPTNFVKVIEHV
jgi:uncharacterized protein YdaU (DUF1376 family)